MKAEAVRPHRGYITAIFFFMILILFLAYTLFDYRNRLVEAESREARMVAERDSLRQVIADLDRPHEQLIFLSPSDKSRLMRLGLRDPVSAITHDLMNRPELIPYEGVLGGTMGFYSPGNIHILSSKWVFAYFEDGHIRGEMLLEYSVESDGSLSWRVIDSHLE